MDASGFAPLAQPVVAKVGMTFALHDRRPSSTNFSISCHVSLMVGFNSGPTFPVTGQWMR
eukprot:scaffold694_cov338-Pavlova_lutheri.AAC.24